MVTPNDVTENMPVGKINQKGSIVILPLVNYT